MTGSRLGIGAGWLTFPSRCFFSSFIPAPSSDSSLSSVFNTLLRRQPPFTTTTSNCNINLLSRLRPDLPTTRRLDFSLSLVFITQPPVPIPVPSFASSHQHQQQQPPTSQTWPQSIHEPIMSSYYNYAHHPHHSSPLNSTPAPSHHGGRGRRAPRLSQNSHKQFRGVRKEEEAVKVTLFRQQFEAARSFDLEDDADFCPVFLSETEQIQSGSDRSSLSSGSPEHSPQSHQVAPDTFSLNSNSQPYVPAYQSQTTSLKIHQPAATRIRNAIPIVNPSSRESVRMASPPQSISPARMHLRAMGQRW